MMRRWIVLFALTAASLPQITYAQDTSVPATVRLGTCATPGDVVVPLTDALLASGQHLGSDRAIPATSSFTTIPVSMDALTASDYVVTIPHPTDDHLLACGEIGGSLNAEGALVLGLEETQDSAVSGVAYLSPADDPAQTNLSLFVFGTPLRDLEAPQVETADASAAQVTEALGSSASSTIADSAASAESARQQYIEDVSAIIDTMVKSFDAFSVLMGNPQIGDETWTINVAVQLAIWQNSYTEAQQLTPPSEFAESHSVLLEALRLYSETATDLANGLDTMDMTLINQAAAKMTQANDLLQQASDLVAAMVP